MKKLPKDTFDFNQYHKQKLNNPLFKKAYDDLELEFQIISLMIQKRRDRNLTQKQLAKKLGIKQPVISSFETGNFNPSIKFLKKLAKSLDSELKVSIS